MPVSPTTQGSEVGMGIRWTSPRGREGVEALRCGAVGGLCCFQSHGTGELPRTLSEWAMVLDDQKDIWEES